MKGFLLPSLLLMIFGGVFGITEATDAQDLDLTEAMVSLNYDQVPLKKALTEIEKQTEFTFAYSYRAISLDRKVSVEAKQQSVEEILKLLFKDQWVSWGQSGRNILLKKWPDPRKQVSLQDIEGVVTDLKTGEPLPGVNILVKGTNIGASTDENGAFELTTPSPQDTLIVSFIGYQTREVAINGRSELTIPLTPKAIMGDEMVVVGYGEQEEINLTGAVSQITPEELDDRPVSNLSKALQGRIPNLNIVIGSGKPGSSGRLNIRGNTSITSSGEPLVLIDGVPGDMDQINPRNVESVSVLKDASAAAVYGARAAFGVILIETKDAKLGETNITYRNNLSWKTFSANTNFETTAHDWLRLNEETYYNALGRKWSGYTEEDYNEIYERRNDETEHPDRPWIEVKPDRSGNDVYKYYGNFDWHNYFYSEWRPKQDHDLSVQGGTDKIQYSLSGTISDETGIMKQNPDSYKRKSFRSKIDYEIFPWLTVSNNTKYFNSKYKYYGKTGGMFDEVHNNLTTNQIYMLSPSYLPQNPDGTNTYLKDDGTYAFGYGAHIAVANDKLQGNDITKDLRTTFEGEINLSDNLNIRANYTFNNERTHYDYRAVRLSYSLYPGEIQQVPRSEWNRDMYYETLMNTDYQVINVFGNYDISLGLHNVELTAGFNQEESIYERVYSEGNELLSEANNDLSLTTGEMQVDGGASEWALRGYFFRTNYNYDSKYLLEISGRYDGTSRFREGDRYGFFPSFSAGWIISNEDFYKPLDNIFDLLKVRASYGTLGNQQVDDYAYISSMSAYEASYVDNGSRPIAINSPSPISPSLTWEKTVTRNVGLDIETLNNRLSINFDTYIRDTQGMLVKGKTLPAVYGDTEPRENAADLRTKGFEVNVNWRDAIDVGSSQLSYNVGLNLSDYTGEITKYDNPNRIISDYYEGQKLGEIWGFSYDGFFETTEEAQEYGVDQSLINIRRMNAPTEELRKLQAGDIKIIDLNGDGVINYGEDTVENPGDRKVIGNSQPRYKFGVHFGGSWKGFDVSGIFQGVGRQHYYPTNENQMFWHVYARPYGTFLPENFEEKMWGPDNPDAYFPRPIGYIAQNSELERPNDMYLQDLAYIKLRNLTVGYSLPNNVLNKVGINRARIYMSGENLFTWTKLDTDYLDPEEVMWDENGRTYPMGKTYSFGVEVTF